MSSGNRLFQMQTDGDVVVLVPTSNLSELESSHFEDEFRAIISQLEEAGHHKIVLDFAGTDYYGSTALGLFVRLWKRICRQNGQLAFCNVSPHEKEVLHLTRLDTLWPICDSRVEALARLRQ